MAVNTSHQTLSDLFKELYADYFLNPEEAIKDTIMYEDYMELKNEYIPFQSRTI